MEESFGVAKQYVGSCREDLLVQLLVGGSRLGTAVQLLEAAEAVAAFAPCALESWPGGVGGHGGSAHETKWSPIRNPTKLLCD